MRKGFVNGVKYSAVLWVLIYLLSSCGMQRKVYWGGVATLAGCATLLMTIKFKAK